MDSNWETKFEYCQYAVRLLNKLQKVTQETHQSLDMQLIKKAIYHARTYHGIQMRASGEPFYSHPLEVAYMLADYLPRTDLLVAAVLHDIIEDTSLTKEMIAASFGETIANKVEDLTRIKITGKISSREMVESLWRQKKFDVLLIKLLDRMHNVQTIWAKSPEKIVKILAETLGDFLWAAAYLGLLDVEKKLAITCSNILSKNQITPIEFVQQSILQHDEYKLPIILTMLDELEYIRRYD